MQSIIQPIFLAILLLVSATFFATPPQSPPNIAVTASLSPDKVQRGRTVKGTVVLDIPGGFHVNSNRPLEKFLIPTQLALDPQNGIRVSAVSYPRAVVRKFKFSKNRVSVYEGRATMSFRVTVPANVSSGAKELKGRLRYQSCNDEVCFPPQSRDVSVWLNVQ